MRLTPANARAIKPGETIRDHEVIGLELCGHVTKTTWRLYYRFHNEPRRPRLGSFPDMSLSAAREVAREWKIRIAKGEDPGGERAAARGAMTVDQLCDRYLEEWAKHNKKASSAREDRLLIECHVRPGLGTRKVASITKHDVNEFIDAVNERRFVSAERKRMDGKATTPGAANHARALLWKMFSFAIDDLEVPGLVKHPVDGSKVFTISKRKRVASPAELTAIVDHLDELREFRPEAAACLWTILLTGARVSEIHRARRDQYVDGKIRLTDHKTMRHVGDREIVVPRHARVILDALPPGGSKYLFGKLQLRWYWRKLRDNAGCPDLTMRDLRKTFASYAKDAGKSLEAVADLFGHTDIKTTQQNYSFIFKPASEKHAEDIADHILRVAGAKPRARPARAFEARGWYVARGRRKRAP